MFSGIGGFDLALNRHGHECIGYSEINKHSIQTYQKNFGTQVKNYGDATLINPDELPSFDLLCGGFPCQAFSIAGKRRGFDDTRGTLFFDIARILKAKRPSLILLENVKGLLNHNKGETFSIIINTIQELGYNVEWMVFNSKFFGVPQNRERVFIIGSLRGTSRPEILPFGEVGGETKELVYAQKSDREIARVYSPEGIAPTLHLKTGGWQEPKIAIPVLTPDRAEKRQNGRRFKENGEPMFTLTGQDKHGVMLRVQGDLDKRKIYFSDECQTLAANPTSDNMPRTITNDLRIRRLTPLECERLQSFPDYWTEGVSDTKRYNQLGNAVTVNVVEAIIKKMIYSHTLKGRVSY
jgi:DNA (cytosine-5)-methyltransferase 1